MSIIEATIAALGKTMVTRAATLWLGDRRQRIERVSSMSELIESTILDRYVRRDLSRQLEAIVDEVVRRLEPFEFALAEDLRPSERRAALELVEQHLGVADLSDESILAIDVDPHKLAERLRTEGRELQRDTLLSDAGERYFNLVLSECCETFVRIVIQLRVFPGRALAESLTRLSTIGDSVAAILRRLPAPTLDAPYGDDLDDEFRRRYLEHVSITLDRLELFGVDLVHETHSPMTVAYLSLAATAEAPKPVGRAEEKQSRDTKTMHDGSVRVEDAVAGSSRTLIRGEAGSGKTTLLRWLAINAARGSFLGSLNKWNGFVPFVISLRRVGTDLPGPQHMLSHAAPMLESIAPPGWVHRQLASRRCLVLIDGVDEVPASRREAVRHWLTELAAAYPNPMYVVTTRPAAVEAQWLSGLAFKSLKLQEMNLGDVKRLIAQWHKAAALSSTLPCEPDELPALQRRLVARLEANLRLRLLATTPLICAMLCALNLDHRGHLPPNRMELYEAALRMLIHRRDVERGVDHEVADSHARRRQDLQVKRILLRDIAWRMALAQAPEVDETKVVTWIERRSLAFHRNGVGPTDGVASLRMLLERSGILREPIPGRVSFIHKTFLEYLAAEDAAEEDQISFLVRSCHQDEWQEMVSLCAGHANGPLRRELLEGLLKRAESKRPDSAAVASVIVRCMETAVDVPPDLQSRIEEQLSRFLPPRNLAEARLVASIGAPMIRRLPDSIDELDEETAAATVMAVGMVNEADSLGSLSRFASDQRRGVVAALLDTWALFDAEQYARSVVAKLELPDGCIEVTRPAQARASVTVLPGVPIRLITDEIGFYDLHEYPPLDSIEVYGPVSDLLPLRYQTGLRSLTLADASRIRDYEPISHMEDLRTALLVSCARLYTLRHFADARSLRHLTLVGVPDRLNVRPLHQLPVEVVVPASQGVYEGVDFGLVRVVRLKSEERPGLLAYPRYF